MQFLLAKSHFMGTLKMLKSDLMFEKTRDYDKDGSIKREVDKALAASKGF